MWDAQTDGNGTAGFTLGAVNAILEVGMVGNVEAAPRSEFVYHPLSTAKAETPLASAMLEAMRITNSPGVRTRCASSLRAVRPAPSHAGLTRRAQVRRATGPYGLPPSSLLALRRAFRRAPDALYLSDFNRAFSTPNYFSQNDNASSITAASVAAAGILVAQTLNIFASTNPSITPDVQARLSARSCLASLRALSRAHTAASTSPTAHSAGRDPPALQPFTRNRQQRRSRSS